MNGFHSQVLTHTDKDRPLPLLRHAEPLCVKHATLHTIARRFECCQYLQEVPLGCALDETTDILGHEHLGFYPAQQSNILIEEGLVLLLGPVLVAFVLAPPLLPLACGAERLARWRTIEQV